MQKSEGAKHSFLWHAIATTKPGSEEIAGLIDTFCLFEMRRANIIKNNNFLQGEFESEQHRKIESLKVISMLEQANEIQVIELLKRLHLPIPQFGKSLRNLLITGMVFRERIDPSHLYWPVYLVWLEENRQDTYDSAGENDRTKRYMPEPFENESRAVYLRRVEKIASKYYNERPPAAEPARVSKRASVWLLDVFGGLTTEKIAARDLVSDTTVATDVQHLLSSMGMSRARGRPKNTRN